MRLDLILYDVWISIGKDREFMFGRGWVKWVRRHTAETQQVVEYFAPNFEVHQIQHREGGIDDIYGLGMCIRHVRVM